ncbi:MFS transporter [Aureimonas endophytica]|nr:MFS transporter [Aureimonas endophytica]
MSTITASAVPNRDAAAPGAWSAVLALSLCVATLIASEFMPVSLLSPIAADLHLTEGQAGQAISVSGAFAVLASLFSASLTRGVDRRHVVLGFTALLVVSGLTVCLAPNQAVLMGGRALLGIAIGGFWSMSTAIVMRLLPRDLVPQGLAFLNAGNAIAATVSAPLGSFLGASVGWRWAFFLVVPLAVVAFVWQWMRLPSLPARNTGTGVASVFGLLARPSVTLGMAGILMLFAGQFALFTYLRPFLEGVTHLDIATLSSMLLAMGLAGVAGTWTIGRLLRTRLFGLLIAIPLAMAAVAVALMAVGAHAVPTAFLLVAWGFFGTAAPVGWGTWLARTLPDEAEAGGGLQVAVIQLAITAGAASGGFLFDALGWQASFGLAATLLCLSAFFAALAWRSAGSVQP